jgi:hypothetical protein
MDLFDLFMTVTSLLLIALFLGLGVWALIYSVRLLRRGEAVTAEEAVKWRRDALKQGFYVSPDMTPDITDILVRAWRSANGWYFLGTGGGALLSVVCSGVYFVLRGIQNPRDSALLVVPVGWLVVLFPCGLIGLALGFARIRREPHDAAQIAHARRLRNYRSRYMIVYALVVSLGNLALMTVLMLRLAPELDRASLTHAFELPGMWTAPLAPAILFIAAIIVELVSRWITDFPALYLPQDANVRRLADDRLRERAVRRIYTLFFVVALVTAEVQFALLDMNPISRNTLLGITPSALNRTGLDYWFLGFFMITMIGAIPFALSIVPGIEDAIPFISRPSQDFSAHWP